MRSAKPVTTPTPAGAIWPARLAYTAAGIFAAASAGINLIYGWQKGTDLGGSLVWAAVSVAVSIVFSLSWPAFLRCLDAKQWSRASMVLVALLITGGYSVTAALGSVWADAPTQRWLRRTLLTARPRRRRPGTRPRPNWTPLWTPSQPRSCSDSSKPQGPS